MPKPPRQSRSESKPEDPLWARLPKSGCCNSGMFQKVITLYQSREPSKPIAKYNICVSCHRRFGGFRVLDTVFKTEHQDMADQTACDSWEIADNGLRPIVFSRPLHQSLRRLNYE
mgnify:FL=1